MKEKTIINTVLLQPNRRQVADIGLWRSAIRSADRGRVHTLYDLFDDLMLDGVLSDAVDERINAVSHADYSFYNSKGKEVDSIIDDVIDRKAFDDLIHSIMMAVIYGRGCAELSISPKGLEVDNIPCQHIDLKRKVIIPDLMNYEKGIDYTKLSNLIVVGKEGYYGLMSKASQYAIYKRGGFGDWAQWIELFGMPQRIGKYHTNDPESKRELLRAMEQMGASPYLVAPKETDIEIRDTQKGSGVAYNDFRKALNEEILISILGQTLTTVAGDRGARSLGEVHQKVEESKNKADILFVTRILNDCLVPFLVSRGYREAAGGYFSVPKAVKDTSVNDLVQLSKIIPIPASYVYDKYGIPVPKDGEAIAGQKVEAPEQVKEDESEDETEEKTKQKAPDEGDEDDNDKEDKQTKKRKKRKLSFFAEALSAAQGSLKNWTTSTTLAAETKIGGIDIKALILDALRRIYDGESEAALLSLFEANNAPLQRGIDLAFESADEELFEFVEEFKYNTSVFNAFKTHAEQEALMQALIDEKGNLRSFRNFKKAVSPILGKYNNTWLQTEYNTAIRAADSARYYQEALRTKHIFPNLEYLESLAKNKREEHLEWVGTILPIEHPWWDKHMPPGDWNCQCSVKKTRKAATEVPPENEDDEQMPKVLRQNPGKTASAFKLDEHPYVHGRGVSSCPECRRQGLAAPTGEGNELCPMHQIAKEKTERIALIAQRKKKYQELLNNPNYKDVSFNAKTGGLKATHKNHNIDKVGGKSEYNIQKVGYSHGHAVILEEEIHNIANKRNIDGSWNGKRMEIVSVETGTANNIRNCLKHCAKKPDVQIAVLNIIPKHYELEHGIAKYNGLKGTSQWIQFEEIIVIYKNKIVAHYTK